MSLFRIKINAAQPAVFDPNPLTVNVNDSAFWFNGDTQPHWPAPSAANPTGWLDFQIESGGVSSQISFNPPGPYTLNYVCALHPGETGQIRVRGQKKSAFAGDTKKGAFGGDTRKGAFGGDTKEGAFGRKTKKGPYGRTTKQGAFGKTAKKGPYGKTTK